MKAPHTNEATGARRERLENDCRALASDRQREAEALSGRRN